MLLWAADCSHVDMDCHFLFDNRNPSSEVKVKPAIVECFRVCHLP